MRWTILFVIPFIMGCTNPLAKFNEVRSVSFEQTIQLSEVNYDAFLNEAKSLLQRATDPADKVVINNYISGIEQTKEMYDKAKVDTTKIDKLKVKYPKLE